MANNALEVFYVYAHKDEDLRAQLDKHLATLKHQKLIQSWHDKEIIAGSLWQEEINSHLKSADIILLLVSADFLNSGYSYGSEMQEAMKRHQAGEARVIPILLRHCDWEDTPFGKLEALPKNGKPVQKWPSRDAAFTEIVKGIREVINHLNGTNSGPTATRSVDKRKRQNNAQDEERQIATTATMLETPKTPTEFSAALKRPLDRYYKELKEYEGKADYELALKSAFQNLLAECARSKSWTLLPEYTLANGVRPDGTIRDDSYIHVNYEQVQEYKALEWLYTRDIAVSWQVEKMRLSTDRRVVVVNESLRLGPIPPECFEYRLGNRSALEWVIDQYQVSKDSRSGIVSDPNNPDDEQYIVRLVGKVVTVSVETVRLVKELEQAVTMADWLDENVEVTEESP